MTDAELNALASLNKRAADIAFCASQERDPRVRERMLENAKRLFDVVTLSLEVDRMVREVRA
jgi:hypothetical protein